VFTQSLSLSPASSEPRHLGAGLGEMFHKLGPNSHGEECVDIALIFATHPRIQMDGRQIVQCQFTTMLVESFGVDNYRRELIRLTIERINKRHGRTTVQMGRSQRIEIQFNSSPTTLLLTGQGTRCLSRRSVIVKSARLSVRLSNYVCNIV